MPSDSGRAPPRGLRGIAAATTVADATSAGVGDPPTYPPYSGNGNDLIINAVLIGNSGILVSGGGSAPPDAAFLKTVVLVR